MATERPADRPTAWEGIEMAVVYIPKVLKSLTEICEAFGVGDSVVKQWAAAGAPIAVEGSGSRMRYSTEMAALQDWRLGRAHACATVPAEASGTMRQSSACREDSTTETS